MAIPTTTAGKLGGADPVVVAGDMGHLTWIFCLFIPVLMLFILDGGRGVRQLWPSPSSRVPQPASATSSPPPFPTS